MKCICVDGIYSKSLNLLYTAIIPTTLMLSFVNESLPVHRKHLLKIMKRFPPYYIHSDVEAGTNQYIVHSNTSKQKCFHYSESEICL